MTPPDLVSFDVVVVGSGPSGTMAAAEAVKAGARTALVDFGADEPGLRARVPDLPFSRLRATDLHQAAYFIGERLEGIPAPGVRVGAQLTPPRRFVAQEGADRLPVRSGTFHPMQSLGLGGLAAAWGAACFTYSAAELERIGLAPEGFDALYDSVAAEIGISAPAAGGDEQGWWSGVAAQQPPLQIDSNGEKLLRAYARRRESARRRGFVLGRIPLAVLSEDNGGRRANPYFDMDFYGDSRESVFRPRLLIERLRGAPGFFYLPGRLAVRFEESPAAARLHCRVGSGWEVIEGRRLILCAGALNTGRLALNSVADATPETTLLCNAYTYLPAINLRMFGHGAREARHSLAQLHAWIQDGPDPADNCSAQLYSYRSLLLFKLVKEIPLTPWLGLQAARALVNSLVICGVFSSDVQSGSKRMRLAARSPDSVPVLEIDYVRSPAEEARRRRLERKLATELRRMGCPTLPRVDPGAAGSIHYAGTLPFENPVNPRLTTGRDFRLAGHRFIFVGDSSSWNWLPSKGLTFTLMAAARRVAQGALATL